MTRTSVQQARYDADQCGLPATTRSDQEGELSLFGLEIDPAQNFDSSLARTKTLADGVTGNCGGSCSSVVHKSASKNDGRLKHQHATQTQYAGEDDDETDAAAGQRDTLPHQDNPSRGELMAEEVEEFCA